MPMICFGKLEVYVKYLFSGQPNEVGIVLVPQLPIKPYPFECISRPPDLNGQVRVAHLPLLSVHVYFLISHYKLGWTAHIMIMRINHISIFTSIFIFISYFVSYYLPTNPVMVLYQWILIFVHFGKTIMSKSLSFDRLHYRVAIKLLPLRTIMSASLVLTIL